MAKRNKNMAAMWEAETKLSEKRTQREFEDLLLKDILIELEVGEEEYWDQMVEEWTDDQEYAPTPEQRAAFEKQLDLEVKRIQKQKRQLAQIHSAHRKKTLQALRRVASIVVFLAVFAGAMLYNSVEAFAAGIDRFIATVVPEDGAKELRLKEKKGGEVEFDAEMFDGKYLPTWVPKGYYACEFNVETYEREIIYTNAKVSYIYFKIATKTYSVVVDDEDVDEEDIYVLDTEGKIVTKNDVVQVVWEDGDYVYTLVGEKKLRDDLIKMAENCERIEAK